MMEHLNFIDIAKGIGIILVLLSHSVLPESMFFSNLFFIPLFFVLSGYTFTTLSLKKKVCRLLKPYFFFNFLIVVMMYVSNMRDISLNQLLGVLYSRYAIVPLNIASDNQILMNLGNSPTWFLTSMFTAFLALSITLKIQDKHRWVILVVYIAATYFMDRLPVLLPWSFDIAFLMSLFIRFGMYIKRGDFISLNWYYVVLMTLIYAFLAYSNGYCNISVRDFGNSIVFYLLGGMVGSYLVMRLSLILDKTCLRNFFVVIGKNSMVIFCIQLPLLFVAQKIFLPITMLLPDPIKMPMLSVFQVIFALVVGCGISRVLNRYLPFTLK